MAQLQAMFQTFAPLPNPTAVVCLPGRRMFEPQLGAWWFAPTNVVYLGLCAPVGPGWLVTPTASLSAFFFISAAHFGRDDARPTVALGADSPFARAGRMAEAAARLGLVIVALLSISTSPESIEARSLRVVFIGLSALTVPHFVFCAFAGRAKASALGVS